MLQRKILVGLAVAGFAFTTTMAVLHPMRTVLPPATSQSHIQLTAADYSEARRLQIDISAYIRDAEDVERQYRIQNIGDHLGPLGTIAAASLNAHMNVVSARANRQWLDEALEDCPDSPTSP
jgi:hypothetical protein